jgi:hypothetical protein
VVHQASALFVREDAARGDLVPRQHQTRHLTL